MFTSSCCQFKGEIDGKKNNFHALVVIYFPCSHLQCQYYQKKKLGIREHFYVTLNYDQYCNYTLDHLTSDPSKNLIATMTDL